MIVKPTVCILHSFSLLVYLFNDVYIMSRYKRPVRCVLPRGLDMKITGKRHPFTAKYKVLMCRLNSVDVNYNKMHACNVYASNTLALILKRRPADKFFGQNRPASRGTVRTPGDYWPIIRRRTGGQDLLVRISKSCQCCPDCFWLTRQSPLSSKFKIIVRIPVASYSHRFPYFNMLQCVL